MKLFIMFSDQHFCNISLLGEETRLFGILLTEFQSFLKSHTISICHNVGAKFDE